MSGHSLNKARPIFLQAAHDWFKFNLGARYPNAKHGSSFWVMRAEFKIELALNPSPFGLPLPISFDLGIHSAATAFSKIMEAVYAEVADQRDCVTYGHWKVWRDCEDMVHAPIQFVPSPI